MDFIAEYRGLDSLNDESMETAVLDEQMDTELEGVTIYQSIEDQVRAKLQKQFGDNFSNEEYEAHVLFAVKEAAAVNNRLGK